MAALGATRIAFVTQPLKNPYGPSFLYIFPMQSITPEYSRFVMIISPVASDTSIACDRCWSRALMTWSGYVVVLATLNEILGL